VKILKSIFAGFLILAAFLAPLRAWAEGAVDSLARNFAAGDQGASVGLYADSGDDAEIEGPQAIYSDEIGQLYLLDQVNNRILKFDPSRQDAPIQSLNLPDGVAPTDLVVTNGQIHVWDDGVVTLQADGKDDAPTRGLTISRAAGPPDEATTTAFAQMGSTNISDDSDLDVTRSLGPPRRKEQVIASRTRGQVVASFSPLGDESGVRIAVAEKQKTGGEAIARLDLRVADRLGAVDVLDIDKQGQIFVLAENIPTDSGGTASAFVARFSSKGALEGVYDLPLAQSGGLSRRFVAVSPDGDVYFLRNNKTSSQILGVGFRPIHGPKVLSMTAPAEGAINLADLARAKGGAVAVRPLTRRQVIETGMQFANIHWKVTPSAYGGDPDTACSGFNRIRRPGYIHGKLNQEVVGVPYCWGCHGGLPIFATMINRGALAGNVCTRNNPRPGVAGVDCSAFVSAAWGLSAHFTTIAIPAITHRLASGWDLLPGDALNKAGSHVMLFVRFTPDRKAEVLESSTGGCNGKVCRNIYPLGSLLARGYEPVRYRALLSDSSNPADAVGANAAAPLGRTKGRE
jgi:hypothetical protein